MKPKPISPPFSRTQIEAAIAAAPAGRRKAKQWQNAIVTHGGGVNATIAEIRRVRGKNKNPTKEQVAIRFDPDVLAAFRAGGTGWQTRMNAALKEWLAAKPVRRTPQRPKSRA